MTDYMIMLGCILESDDETVLREHAQSMMKTVRAALVDVHGMPDDQFVGIYIMKLTPEQAKMIIDAPDKGMLVAQSLRSILKQ